MKNSIVKKLFCLIALLCALTACIKQKHAVSGELVNIHSGSLHVPSSPDAPMRIYVEAPGHADMAERLARSLGNSHFKVVDAPSRAGYILHITVLHNDSANTDSLRQAVDSGYGSKVAIARTGPKAMLADALMVQRKVPEAKRPTRQKLKNITSRNALASAQMRLAVTASSPSDKPDTEAISQALAAALADRIKN